MQVICVGRAQEDGASCLAVETVFIQNPSFLRRLLLDAKGGQPFWVAALDTLLDGL